MTYEDAVKALANKHGAEVFSDAFFARSLLRDYVKSDYLGLHFIDIVYYFQSRVNFVELAKEKGLGFSRLAVSAFHVAHPEIGEKKEIIAALNPVYHALCPHDFEEEKRGVELPKVERVPYGTRTASTGKRILYALRGLDNFDSLILNAYVPWLKIGYGDLPYLTVYDEYGEEMTKKLRCRRRRAIMRADLRDPTKGYYVLLPKKAGMSLSVFTTGASLDINLSSKGGKSVKSLYLSAYRTDVQVAADVLDFQSFQQQGKFFFNGKVANLDVRIQGEGEARIKSRDRSSSRWKKHAVNLLKGPIHYELCKRKQDGPYNVTINHNRLGKADKLQLTDLTRRVSLSLETGDGAIKLFDISKP